MTEERAILLWRAGRAGLSPAFFGDDVAGNWCTNEKLERIVHLIEEKPPTAVQTAAFLRRWQRRTGRSTTV